MYKIFILFLKIVSVYETQEYPKYILYVEEINGIEYINYFEVSSSQEEDTVNDLVFKKVSGLNICNKILNSSLFCDKSKKFVKELMDFIE